MGLNGVSENQSKILVADDYPLFTNLDRQTIIVSVACDNGAFYIPLQRSMCKRYLFSADGGAIAYIANPNVTIYPYSMPFLLNTLENFKEYPSMSIGKVVALAKKYECFGAGKSFEVFGDPALNRGLTEVSLSLELTDENTVFCGVDADVLREGEVYWELSVMDTTWYDTTWKSWEYRTAVVESGTGLLNNGNILLEPDLKGIQEKAQLTVYAWNGSVAGYGAITLEPENPVVALTPDTENGGTFPLLRIISNEGRYARLEFPKSENSDRLIAIYSLHGRKITSLVVPRNTGYTLFDKQSVASGTHVARFIKQTHSAGVLFRIP